MSSNQREVECLISVLIPKQLLYRVKLQKIYDIVNILNIVLLTDI
jgi:hypothetical protein